MYVCNSLLLAIMRVSGYNTKEQGVQTGDWRLDSFDRTLYVNHLLTAGEKKVQYSPQWSMHYMGVNLCDVFNSVSQDSPVYVVEQLKVEAYPRLGLNWNSWWKSFNEGNTSSHGSSTGTWEKRRWKEHFNFSSLQKAEAENNGISQK